MDLARARPLQDFLLAQPAHTVESTLAIEGEDYAIYLADEREREDPGCGEKISGDLELELPSGRYRISCYAPETGGYSPALDLAGGRQSISVPGFHHDIVVRIKRRD